jgi:uncharacterized protein YqeY
VAAGALKACLRADLKAAMQARRGDETALLRMLIGVIDNAEAVPVPEIERRYTEQNFGEGANELPRRVLDDAMIAALLAEEIASRNAAADQFERGGQPDRAAALRMQAAWIARYRS